MSMSKNGNAAVNKNGLKVLVIIIVGIMLLDAGILFVGQRVRAAKFQRRKEIAESNYATDADVQRIRNTVLTDDGITLGDAFAAFCGAPGKWVADGEAVFAIYRTSDEWVEMAMKPRGDAFDILYMFIGDDAIEDEGELRQALDAMVSAARGR